MMTAIYVRTFLMQIVHNNIHALTRVPAVPVTQCVYGSSTSWELYTTYNGGNRYPEIGDFLATLYFSLY